MFEKFSGTTFPKLNGIFTVGFSNEMINLSYSNLSDSDLSFANLRDAKLGGSDLQNAKLDKAIWIDGRICAAGSIGNCL